MDEPKRTIALVRHRRRRPRTPVSGFWVFLAVVVGACAGIAAFGLLDPILTGWGL